VDDRPAPPTRDTDRVAELRAAVEAAGRRAGTNPGPEFSSDGGVTVSDPWGRSARVQPLGQRVRVSLAVHGQFIAEGEVDADELLARMAVRENPYDAVADALDQQNGPGYRSE
jgi:hypothetical protein